MLSRPSCETAPSLPKHSSRKTESGQKSGLDQKGYFSSSNRAEYQTLIDEMLDLGPHRLISADMLLTIEGDFHALQDKVSSSAIAAKSGHLLEVRRRCEAQGAFAPKAFANPLFLDQRYIDALFGCVRGMVRPPRAWYSEPDHPGQIPANRLVCAPHRSAG